MVTSLDTEEAFKGVLSLRNLFIITTVIVLAIAIIAIDLVVDRTISKPLTTLKNVAIEIGKGNLDLIIAPPSTIDEIGELSSQFAKMRERIKARTEELMRRDKELKTDALDHCGNPVRSLGARFDYGLHGVRLNPHTFGGGDHRVPAHCRRARGHVPGAARRARP